MKQIKKTGATISLAIKSNLNELTLPVILEFILATLGDFLEPRLRMLVILFFIFAVISIYHIAKVYNWAGRKNISLPLTTDQLYAGDTGLKKSFTKNLSIAITGLVVSSIFVLLQLLFSQNSRGTLASVFPDLQPMQQSLLGIESNLKEINKKLDNVKKETSDNARKELQNMGVAWNGKNFGDAVKSGDELVVSLFLEGGMRPETAESDGRSISIMLALNEYNPEKILSLLLEHGLDINYRFGQFASVGEMKTTMLGNAIQHGNVKLAKALLQNDADTDSRIQTYGSMAATIEMYPLESAIYWKKKEIVYLILDADPEISAGDYAAYRQAFAMKENYYWKENEPDLQKILAKIKPSGKTLQRINAELRVIEIDNEINKTFLESLQSLYSSYEKKAYEQKMEELRAEKAKLEEIIQRLK